MRGSYKTIKDSSEAVFKDRGSKFLAFAYSANNESDIKELLNERRKKYHDARHHCYAWRLGTDQIRERSNDDGEPANSAGKPILTQIQKRDLSNVLVVVVRYFGGTLLGVGGLINAYRSAAGSALENADIIEKKIRITYIISFRYEQTNFVMKLIRDFEIEILNQQFEESCSMKVLLDQDLETKVCNTLSSAGDIEYSKL